VEIITNSNNTITIKGHISTLNHYMEIKQVIHESIAANNLQAFTILIPDSNTITSSMIGFFIKIVNMDRINLTLKVGQEDLFNMLKDLNVATLFNLEKL